ncbi:MAG: hypothetical protein AB7G93_01375 [Bdellovibrionales bacterium]
MKINKPITIVIALVLTGCTATEFGSRELASSSLGRASDEGSSGASGSDADGSSDTGSAPTSSLPESCRSSLREIGFELKSRLWVLRKKTPCSSGIGFVEFEYTIEDSDSSVCDDIPSISNRIGDAVARAQYEDQLVARLPDGFSERKIKESCAQTQRCGEFDSAVDALGRLAWLKKCENKVAVFKEYLDAVRELEKGYGKAFYRFYPRINLKSNPNQDGRVDEGPSVTVVVPRSMNGVELDRISRVDDLGHEEIQRQVTAPCPEPNDVEPIDVVCAFGCYRADQRILTAATGEYTPVKKARAQDLKKIAVLSAESTLEKPRYVDAPVGQYTETLKDSQETLVTIRTSSGLQLVVTTNHPLLDGEGIMREAADLKVGDDLVKADGRRDKIVSLERSSFFGRVYNVAPVSRAPEDNLVVSEGLINGSHHYQTELHQMVNRQIVRTRLADGI